MKFPSLLGKMTIGALLFAGASQTCLASLTVDQRVADFNELATTYERNYGPLRLKAQTIGLDWNKNKSDFLSRVTASKSDAEFYQILTQFLASLHDAHVSATVPSTYSAKLGFICDLIQGKVVIDQINTLRLPNQLFPFKRGDQLISIDGVPVEQLMAQLSLSDNTGNDLSTKRIAAARLTSRSEGSGFAVPEGVSLISVLPKGASEPITVTATWIVSGTPIAHLDDLSKLLESTPVVNSIQAANDGESLTDAIQKLPLYNIGMPRGKMADWLNAGITDLGSSNSMFALPAGATTIDGVSMTAAIYEAAGKKIGILRVPSYEGDTLMTDIATAIQELETKTDVLVLDQTNNPGGAVATVSQLVSIFADKSYKDMNFTLRPSMEWANQIDQINQQINNTLASDPKDTGANALQARFAYLSKAIRDGMASQQFLIKPISLDLENGYGMIQPQTAVRYTKPVLLLINEFDFSGGDAFPAVMQDNGRVTTFGHNTSGAGGNVADYGPLTNSYFKYSVTQSLMVRPNGNYVENKGVSADIPYDITEDDFNNGYQGYMLAFTQAALKLAGVDASIPQLQAEQAAKAQAAAAAQALQDALKKAAAATTPASGTDSNATVLPAKRAKPTKKS